MIVNKFLNLTATLIVIAAVVSGGGKTKSGPQSIPLDRSTSTEHSTTLDSLRSLIEDEQLDVAVGQASELLVQLEKEYGAESIPVAEAIDVLVEALWLNGKASDPRTIELAERAIRIKETILGPDDIALSTSLTNRADMLAQAGKYNLSLPFYQRSLDVTEASLGAEHPDVASRLDDVAACLRVIGKFDEARAHLERGREIRTKAFGAEHPEVATSLGKLGDLERYQDHMKEARSFYEEAVHVMEQTYGTGSFEIIESLDKLGMFLMHIGELKEARPLLERVLEIRTKTLGREHPRTAESMNKLAYLVRKFGDYGAARQLFENALKIYEEKLGPDHPNTAQTLNNYGTFLIDAGDYVGGREALERANEIRVKAHSSHHPDVAAGFMNLGIAHGIIGDNNGAIRSYQRALEVYETAYGPEHVEVAYACMSLGKSYRIVGEGERARTHLERARDIDKKASGEANVYFANDLTQLGFLASDEGDDETALELHETSLRIWEDAMGSESSYLIGPLEYVAALRAKMGFQDEALELYMRTLALAENSFGASHPRVATRLQKIAKLHSNSGNYVDARALLERAVEIQTTALGADHPDVADSQRELARLLARMQHHNEAFELALLADRVTREHVRLTAQALPERQALRYASSVVSSQDLTIAIAAEMSATGGPVEQAFDALVQSRALVLDEMGARNRVAEDANDPETDRLSARLRQARQRLANLTIRGPSGSSESYRNFLAAAQEDKERSERELAAHSAAFRDKQAKSRIRLHHAAEALGSADALVSYVKYRSAALRPDSVDSGRNSLDPQSRLEALGRNSDTFYGAFVIGAGQSRPTFVPLGLADDIDRSVSRWRAAIGTNYVVPARGVELRRDELVAEEAYRRVGHLLRRQTWEPVVSFLADAERAFVVPDGSLNLVNFAALPSGESAYLVETGPLIHYLSCERDLAQVGSERDLRNNSLLAIGGPDFDAVLETNDDPSTSLASAATNAAAMREEDASDVAARSRRSECDEFVSVEFGALPGSQKEVHEIVQIWKENMGSENATLLTEHRATEAAFRSEVTGSGVLHFATHGFFLSGSCPSSTNTAGPTSTNVALTTLGENPLLLSGLALSGANRRGVATSGENDGILTAEEIATLDLSSVDWAVLSACDTGVGVIQSGEGVFGLRRAFQIAGANTLIMSLWAVDDESARRWMNALYEGRLRNSLGTAEAVRHACLDLLGEQRATGRTTHPFYWASFVAAGDWR